MGGRRPDIARVAMDAATKVTTVPAFEQVMGPFTGIIMDYGDVLNSLLTLVSELQRIEDTGCETWEYVKAEVIPNSVPEGVRKLIGLDW